MRKYVVLLQAIPEMTIQAERLTYDGTGSLIFTEGTNIILMIAAGHWIAVRDTTPVSMDTAK